MQSVTLTLKEDPSVYVAIRGAAGRRGSRKHARSVKAWVLNSAFSTSADSWNLNIIWRFGWVFSKTKGAFLGLLCNKDPSILRSVLGPVMFWQLPMFLA